MLYRLDGVRKGFGPRDVLLHATFQHDPSRIVGLVGRNGAGKTTVLKIVSGALEPDGGRRFVAGGTSFASLDQAVEPEGEEPLRAFVARAQEPLLALAREMARLEEAIAAAARVAHNAEGPEHPHGTGPGHAHRNVAIDALLAEHDTVRERFERGGGYEADSRVERVLTGVGIFRQAWDRPVGELSGGQKHRAQMARLLLTDASVLLLDEPTNHLDVSGIEFLEAWLRERREGGKAFAGGAALVVSHDRRFLDAVADEIVDVSHGRLVSYPGNYATYRRLKAERDRLRAKAADEERRLVAKTEEFIRRNIAGQKTKQAQSRRKMLARMERIEAPRENVNDVTFRFEESRRSGERVLEVRDLVVGHQRGAPLLSPVSFQLPRGSRVALWGPNGCGKTTLLKTLARVVPALSGTISYGAGVTVGYYDQEMADLSPSARVLDVVMDLDPSMREGEARDFLALFDFRNDEVVQRIGTLSGGEKGRLSLARITFSGASLLLLDEPTNHLDLDAREKLEEALADFEGVVVFVSHDRWFVDRLATHVLEIHSAAAELLAGNYSDLMARRAERAQAASRNVEAASESARSQSAGARGAGRGDGRENRSDRRRAKAGKRVKELEASVSGIEESLRELDLSLTDPLVYRDGERVRAIKGRRDAARRELELRLAEWEEASRQMEEEVSV